MDFQDTVLCDFVAATNIADLGYTGWSCLNRLPVTDICGSSYRDSWSSVTCTDGKVISISMYASSLSGTLPSSLGQLTSLTFLYISYTKIYGTIPSTFGGLSKLVYLYLYENKLTGTIPSSLQSMKSLSYLYLSYNLLSGSIPSSLCNMTSLYELTVNGNTDLTCYPLCLTTITYQDVETFLPLCLSDGKYVYICNVI